MSKNRGIMMNEVRTNIKTQKEATMSEKLSVVYQRSCQVAHKKRRETVMKKKNALPKYFGKELHFFLNGISSDSFKTSFAEVIADMPEQKKAMSILAYQILPNISDRKLQDEVISTMVKSEVCTLKVALLIGYVLAKHFNLHYVPPIQKDLEYIKERMPFLVPTVTDIKKMVGFQQRKKEKITRSIMEKIRA
jgi:hypothetical protein